MPGGTSQKARRARRRRAAAAAAAANADSTTPAARTAKDRPAPTRAAGPRRRLSLPRRARTVEAPSRSSATPTSGRVTARSSGRYTAPIPRSERHSPRWYPFVILALLFIGVITTVLNYLNALPNSPSDWYTVGGIVCILAGVFAATFYR